jgi:cation:H+ antiporter
MEILISILALVVGVAVLGYGADLFVEASSRLARRLGISPVVIGLTVVAFGTSAPEMAVNIMGAAQGSSGIAFGNVVGSNIFNVMVILGLCAMIKPLLIKGQLLKIDIPIMCGASALLWWFAQDGVLSKIEAAALTAGIIGYVTLQVRLALKERQAVKQEFEQEFSEGGTYPRNLILLAVGLVLLVVGARLFVYGAVELARLWGISETVIALTIVSAGTSLPEVATSVAATLKGEKEIAIGNVVGSNIFNLLAVMGISGLVAPLALTADTAMSSIDIPVMLLSSLLLAPLAHFRGKLELWVGALFLIGYAGYLVLLIQR